MLNLTNLSRTLSLITLVFGCSLGVKAQRACGFGLNIYVRDEAGKSVENGKLEVSVSGGKGKLPGNVVSHIDKDGLYRVAAGFGSTLKGEFVFKISAEGFETYERQFNFPVCEYQSFELRLQPKGSSAKAHYERLLILHGKVFDEEKRPLGNAKVEATSVDGRVYQTFSNPYGYYEIGLPRGLANIRISDDRFPSVVFDKYKIEKNYSVLNVPVCLKCNRI